MEISRLVLVPDKESVWLVPDKESVYRKWCIVHRFCWKNQSKEVEMLPVITSSIDALPVIDIQDEDAQDFWVKNELYHLKIEDEAILLSSSA